MNAIPCTSGGWVLPRVAGGGGCERGGRDSINLPSGVREIRSGTREGQHQSKRPERGLILAGS